MFSIGQKSGGNHQIHWYLPYIGCTERIIIEPKLPLSLFLHFLHFFVLPVPLNNIGTVFLLMSSFRAICR